MAYQFTKDLETGNATIDSEHRQLIQAVNDLLAACSHGKGRAELEKTPASCLTTRLNILPMKKCCKNRANIQIISTTADFMRNSKKW